MKPSEQEYIEPPKPFVEQANCREDKRDADFPECFEEYAEILDWDEEWDEVLDASDPPFYKWFTGGKLNASHNCVDRHLAERGARAALIWEGEPGESREITYEDLHREVNELAAALRDVGIQEDDVVTLHLPMLPALPITMLALARIGAPHSEVFGGFSAEAVADRMNDADSGVLITCDGYYRRGTLLNHKEKADRAVEHVDHDVENVLVWRRHDELHEDAELVEGRDLVVQDLMEEHRGAEVEPVTRDAEDPLFLVYTSGTTGKPKGCQHSTGGYLA